MRLTFVGHAAVLLEQGEVGLLCDPWLVGDAFNEGWAMWPAPRLDDAELDRVTHLWVSHEHPDHLSVATLRGIPAERRAGITALYQHHWSGAVADFLRTLGFEAVVELDHGVPVMLGPSVEVSLHQVGHEDAALAVKGGGTTVLDLNDCKPSDEKLARIRAAIGPVDVLVDQFSIAGWPGNPEDVARHRRVATGVLDGLARHVAVLEPRWLLPAASFIRFVSPENDYINGAGNPVAAVVDRIGAWRTAVLRPGDEWDLDDPWTGTDEALARYALDEPLPPGGLRRHGTETIEVIEVAARARVAALQVAHRPSVLRRVAPVTFVVTDLGARIVVDLTEGVRRLRPEEEVGRCVVEVTSQAAADAFRHRWGLTTLAISGRLRVRGDEVPFTRLKQVAAATSSGFRSRGVLGDARSPRGVRFLRHRWRDVVPELLGRTGRPLPPAAQVSIGGGSEHGRWPVSGCIPR